MPTADIALRREAIHRRLAHHAGRSQDARGVIEAAGLLWRHASAQLTPVIGTRGVEALFSRALHQTGSVYPRLVISGDFKGSAAALAAIESRWADQQPAALIEASCALLSNFSELLGALIGESLTDRLLRPVWEIPTPSSVQEPVS